MPRPRPAHGARRVSRLLVAGAIATASVLTGGVAFAWWSTTGSGSGSATTGTTVALTTSASTPSGTVLVPGGSAPLVITVTNPNAGSVTITSVQLDTSRSVTVSGEAGTCTAPPLTVSATPSLVLAGGATTTFTVPNAVTLGSAAANGCQGATFTLPVTLTGRTS